MVKRLSALKSPIRELVYSGIILFFAGLFFSVYSYYFNYHYFQHGQYSSVVHRVLALYLTAWAMYLIVEVVRTYFVSRHKQQTNPIWYKSLLFFSIALYMFWVVLGLTTLIYGLEDMLNFKATDLTHGLFLLLLYPLLGVTACLFSLGGVPLRRWVPFLPILVGLLTYQVLHSSYIEDKRSTASESLKYKRSLPF